MTYRLRVLSQTGTDPDALVAPAEAAIVALGEWEASFEVRMGAGPTVCITSESHVLNVSVTWGSQSARAEARDLRSAIECADRIAHTFYEIRAADLIR